jgi:uncharacterized membrane protein YfcA
MLPGIALIGIVAGWVTGASAAAWGALSVPLLILLGVEPLAAISASLGASIFLSLFGGLTHWRYDHSRVAPLFPLLLGGVGGAFVGSFLSPALPTQALHLLIGVTTLIIGVVMLVRRNGISAANDTHEPMKWHERRAAIFGIGVVAGFSAGAIGAGWGTIGVALLVWTGIPGHTVVGSSLMARSVVAVAATGSYVFQMGLPPADVFLPLLLAGGAGVYLGVRTSNGLSPLRMRKFLGGVVTLVGILTVIGIPW